MLPDFSVGELAALVGGRVTGDAALETRINGVAGVADAAKGHITFLGNSKYLPALKISKASAALVPLDFDKEIPAIQIRVENPMAAFAKILEKFAPAPVPFEPGVHATAVIGKDVVIGRNVSIQPYVVIESGAKIGDGTFIGAHSYIGHGSTIGSSGKIHPHVTIRENITIGNRVMIHSGTVVGSDGFGYEFTAGKHVKIPQTGIVQIDDDVEIGANTTIDRARFGKTWIQEGVKIDNLVQIAHNVIIGKHSIIVAQVGISGSTRLGNYVTLAGQVGVVGHVEIGDKAIIAAQAGVIKSVPGGAVWFGTPAMPLKELKVRQAHLNRLPKLSARVKKIEQILDSKSKSLPEES